MIATSTSRAMLPLSTGGEVVLRGSDKFAVAAVKEAYFANGGQEFMNAWAAENPGDYFTKMFVKLIPRQVDMHVDNSVEALLDRLDGSSEALVIDVVSELINVAESEARDE